MVVQAPQFPKTTVPPISSRYAYSPRGDNSIPRDQMAPSTSPFSSLKTDLSPECGGGTTPVQDSEQDSTQSSSRPSHPMSPSGNFYDYSQLIQADALRAGVSPDHSRKLADVMREYTNLWEEFENARIHQESEQDYFRREKARLRRAYNEVDKARKCEREEFEKVLKEERQGRENDVRGLIHELEKLRLEKNEIEQKGRATAEKNEALKEDLRQLESTMKEMQNHEPIQKEASEKCKGLKNVILKKLCTQMYDTTLHLDHELQSVLDNTAVHDEMFKERVRELKTEVEKRKNATWP